MLGISVGMITIEALKQLAEEAFAHLRVDYLY